MILKPRLSRGFTLVELAIVLIVIGLLLGMAFKGKNLVDAARIKAEITKVSKIQTAFNTFKAKYDRLPGQPLSKGSSGSIESNQKIYEELIKEGLLSESDFRSNLQESRGKYWFFAGCEPQAVLQSTQSSWKISADFSLENVCMYLSDMHPKDTGPLTGPHAQMGTDAQMVCWIETMLDNKNILTGDGRKTVVSMDSWKTDGVFDNTLSAPCGDKKAYNSKIMWYAMRIY